MYSQSYGWAREAAVRRPAAHIMIHCAGLAQRVRKQSRTQCEQTLSNTRRRAHIITCAGLIALYLPLLAVISKAFGTDSIPSST